MGRVSKEHEPRLSPDGIAAPPHVDQRKLLEDDRILVTQHARRERPRDGCRLQGCGGAAHACESMRPTGARAEQADE
jgi:hypothetical protein